MAMAVETKGNKLCIEIDLEKPTPSASGKTLVVASTRGNTVTTAMVDGKPVYRIKCLYKPYQSPIQGSAGQKLEINQRSYRAGCS